MTPGCRDDPARRLPDEVSVVAPAAVAHIMAVHRFGRLDRAGGGGLAAFQADGAARLERIIRAFGGAVLADSVGLGKTHVAAALIRRRRDQGLPVLVTGPSALAAHWKRHLRGCHGWLWRSHAAMSRRGAPALPAKDRALVVVDEAHAFRNPATRRYAALAACATGSDLLLLTATPVNNGVHDFYHLLRLFAGDDAFAELGVPDLRNAVELAADGNGAPIRRVAGAVMVRRTRSDVRLWQQVESGTPALRFPERAPAHLVRYDIDSEQAERYSALAVDVMRLRFPVHTVSAAAPVELLRLGLLKRLESSEAAFLASLRLHRRTLHEFVAAAADGWLLDMGAARRLLRETDGAVQLTAPGVALARWPAHLDAAALIDLARADEARILRMQQTLQHAGGDMRDAKAEALADLVAGDYAGDSVVVFTEFRDTARMLWARLVGRDRVGYIDGEEARLGRSRASRRVVIDRFAPLANRAGTPAARERVRVLIATDVLAEGLNLQDARVVVSYDLPWNPVRLAQRIGRIDRLGSPHERVVALVFAPGHGLDAVLRLTRRVKRKLREIRVVGGDAPWIAGTNGHSTEADLVERLRVLAARADEDQPPGTGGRPVAAAIRWHGPGRAALCCVLHGPHVRLWLVPARGAPQPEPDCAAELLLAALTADGETTACDVSRAAAAGARALRACLQPAAPSESAGPAAARAACLVHRWLRRHAGRSESAYRDADSVLAWLSRPGNLAAEAAVAAVLRAPGGDSARVAALLRLAESRAKPPTAPAQSSVEAQPANGPGVRTGVETGPAGPRLVAVLELLPASEGRPENERAERLEPGPPGG